ncbi:MAG: macrolide ABC transporter ATP-binding protein [Candidatus Marinimicrobia bacterium CG08_land_8_20_14_0_20_45_22]|nr:MAG: macrolide ABC transporter ATP-binding protein [Candidatus Marinimicrobia bacterium CG08_land_8_20_14_0_20_45_22]
MENNENVIVTNNLTKVYQMGDVRIHALKGINLTVRRGEFIAIMGASGSGKSTLMNMLGCLDQPTSGDYFLDGENVNSLDRNEYAEIRNQKIGFVFQGFNLLARTTALENVELPLMYDRHNRIQEPQKAAKSALERVGLADRMNHLPNQLSGGQQQRVAIARALVTQPAILMADEPTGNLDSLNSIEIFGLFQTLNQEGITIVMVTHERDFADYATRIVEMRDGRIRKDWIIQSRRNAQADLTQYKANGSETEDVYEQNL